MRRFIRSARSHGLRAGLAWALAAVGSPLGIAVLLLSWWWPWLLLPLGGLAVAVFALAALLALRMARRRATARLVDGLPSARAGILADGIATWVERDATGSPASPMTEWLCADLDQDLRALPPDLRAAAGRRRLGGVRYLIPVFVLVCLCWLVWRFMPPPIPGLLGGGVLSAGPGQGQGPGSGQGGAGAPDRAGEPDDVPRPPPPKPPPVEDQPPPPPSQPAPPAPLLQAPEEQQFVVPQFIGDGPSRQALVQAAGIDDGGAGSRRPPPPTARQGGEAPPPSSPPSDEQFQRAVEQALQSRHVPPAERPIVERFFRALREKQKR